MTSLIHWLIHSQESDFSHTYYISTLDYSYRVLIIILSCLYVYSWRRMKNCPRHFRTYSHLFCHWAYKSKLIIVEHECIALQRNDFLVQNTLIHFHHITKIHSLLFDRLIFPSPSPFPFLRSLRPVTVRLDPTKWNNSKSTPQKHFENISSNFSKTTSPLNQSTLSASTQFILYIFLYCFFQLSTLESNSNSKSSCLVLLRLSIPDSQPTAHSQQPTKQRLFHSN